MEQAKVRESRHHHQKAKAKAKEKYHRQTPSREVARQEASPRKQNGALIIADRKAAPEATSANLPIQTDAMAPGAPFSKGQAVAKTTADARSSTRNLPRREPHISAEQAAGHRS